MDTLTRLIQLARPQASLELRCQLAGKFALPHQSPTNVAPFHLALQGRCAIETPDGALLTLEAGDMVMFPKGGAHWIRDIDLRAKRATKPTFSHDGLLTLERVGSGEPDIDLLCGRFNYAQGPAALLLHSLPDPLHVSLIGGDGTQRLHALVALMRDEAERQQPGALAIVTALSHALFAMALRAYGVQHPEASNVLTLSSDPRLGPSIQALLTEPGRAWTIEELGGISAMSRATYARHFREKAGMTVWEFLTQVRMTIASDLLLHTKRNAADIGMEVGYQSEAAFGKAFQQHMGITPGRYRRSRPTQ
jgi:AraC family transcriptional activator of mtrCDE